MTTFLSTTFLVLTSQGSERNESGELWSSMVGSGGGRGRGGDGVGAMLPPCL